MIAIVGNGRLELLREKFIGQIATVDGPQPGFTDDSWKGDLFRVIDIEKDFKFKVSLILDYCDGFMRYDGINCEPYISRSLTNPFHIDPKKFRIRLVTPDDMLHMMMKVARDWDDHGRRVLAQKGYSMKKD